MADITTRKHQTSFMARVQMYDRCQGLEPRFRYAKAGLTLDRANALTTATPATARATPPYICQSRISILRFFVHKKKDRSPFGENEENIHSSEKQKDSSSDAVGLDDGNYW